MSGIKRDKVVFESLGVEAQLSVYFSKDGAEEYDVMLRLSDVSGNFLSQLSGIANARESLLKDLLSSAQNNLHCVSQRCFLSDIANQQELVREYLGEDVGMVQQSPLDGSKIALWMLIVRGSDFVRQGQNVLLQKGGCKHIWSMGLCAGSGDSFAQTRDIISEYESYLQSMGGAMEPNCMRTWLYVRDIDNNYAGMVRSRRELFESYGMNSHTHYIASTGIEGKPWMKSALVQMDAYSIVGEADKMPQIQYLYGREVMNPTSEYGVTFERGVKLQYSDYSQIFISGTASINNKGEVVHVGDVQQQCCRAIHNIETLLAEAGSTLSDVMYMIVYLRDIADYSSVKAEFDKIAGGSIPSVYVLAPVCRPEWLVEMECVAIIPR